MKTTKGLIVSDYVTMRNYIIDEIINNVKSQWPKDVEILSNVIDLTIQLKTAKPDVEFVQDMKGFMFWAEMTRQSRGHAISTLIHDLSEFARNRHEKWFCPRTYGYRKYLSGVTS